MKISAIISEYNPFHKGHLHHINYTKEVTGCDALVCIMSGSFMQRGIPAIVDKWKRAEMAIMAGADLIIELPAVFSVSSAEFFAKGAIDILTDTQIVDYLSFGSESGDITLIEELAHILADEPREYKVLLKKKIKEGLPFAKARSIALISYLSNKSDTYIDYENLEKVINSPNNILAIEYCKALRRRGSAIKPITLQRVGDGYNDPMPVSEYASATALRNVLKEGKLESIAHYVPYSTFQALKAMNEAFYNFVHTEDMFPYLKYKLLLNKNLHRLPDVREGLDNKLYNEVRNAATLKDLIEGSKSKRYTYTRLSRILCQYFIGFESYPIETLRNSAPDYIRILAFNDRGRAILKEMKDKSTLNIITKIPKEPTDMLKIDLQSTAAYSILNPAISSSEDYLRKPIYL